MGNELKRSKLDSTVEKVTIRDKNKISEMPKKRVYVCVCAPVYVCFLMSIIRTLKAFDPALILMEARLTNFSFGTSSAGHISGGIYQYETI